jgi:predicted transposase/invertase (TIGR01784 family)
MRWQLDYNSDLEIAEKKGREEGREEGREKEKEIVVLNMHKNKFGIPAIQLATGLSEEKIREILLRK